MDESFIPFGAEHIKKQANLTDEGTVVHLCESPYAQYRVGLQAFRKEPLFDAPMRVHCKRHIRQTPP